MKYSIDWLKQKYKQGEEVKYFFFWGHKQQNPAVVDKSCLSQWFPTAFKVERTLYHTAEHWMMAEKARLFNDPEALEEILKTTKPGTAKSWGRKVKDFDAALWKAKCFDIVVEGNVHKFSQHKPLTEFLLTTGNKIIVEASPRDTIWGIGLGQDRKEAQHPDTWRGTNLLGFALMEVRDKLLS